MPAARTVSNLKSKLLQPALTSHYEVYIGIPGGDFTSYLGSNGIRSWPLSQEKIQLACSEALLPGSQFATHEINGDRTGVTERHAYRRNYDDRIDLTFYVDVDNRDPYVAITFFEVWMKYITNESIAGENSVKNGNFFYQVKYPSEYYGSLKITKFERTGKNNFHSGPNLTYNFVNAYPININSMPVSYETSQLLKVTVSFSYIRYYIESLPGSDGKNDPNTNPAASSISPYAPDSPLSVYNINPETQAKFNTTNFAFPGSSLNAPSFTEAAQFNFSDSISGIPKNVANAAGRDVNSSAAVAEGAGLGGRGGAGGGGGAGGATGAPLF